MKMYHVISHYSTFHSFLEF